MKNPTSFVLPHSVRRWRSLLRCQTPVYWRPIPEMLVVSHGGVGTTFLIEHLQRFKSLNDSYDHDGLKHLCQVPRWLSKETSFLYVCGNPVEAALSLCRRNYAHVQASKNGMPRKLEPCFTIEELAESDSDLLGLTNHLASWYQCSKTHSSSMVVSYNQLWDSVGQIGEKFSLPKDFESDFPKKSSRASRASSCSAGVLGKLEAIYRDYFELLAEIESSPISRS